MSTPDYSQKPEDLQSLLVLLRFLSQPDSPSQSADVRSFRIVYDELSRLRRLSLPKEIAAGRSLSLRYRSAYSPANAQWGDLQIHRRPLALLSIGFCSPDASLRDFECRYNDVKYRHGDGVLDSRLILIGRSSLDDENNVGVHGKGSNGTTSVGTETGSNSRTLGSSGPSGGSLVMHSDHFSTSMGDEDDEVLNSDSPSADGVKIHDDEDVGLIMSGRNYKNSTGSDSECFTSSGPCKDIVGDSFGDNLIFGSETSNTSVGDKQRADPIDNLQVLRENSLGTDNPDSDTRSIDQPVIGKENCVGNNVSKDGCMQNRQIEVQSGVDMLEEKNGKGDEAEGEKPLKIEEDGEEESDNEEEEEEEYTAGEEEEVEDRSDWDVSPVTKSQLICYKTLADCLEHIVEDLKPFLVSIFHILDGKRLGAVVLKPSASPPLLTAPFERTDPSCMDMESKVIRRRAQGRTKKNLGDLCLITGLTVEAVLHYQVALDILRSTGDWLWAAAALEGLCAASVIVHYNRNGSPTSQQSSPHMSRNYSFSHHPTARAPSILSQGYRTLNPGSLSAGLGSGLDLAAPKMKYIIPPDDIVHRYCDVIHYYEKYPEAVILEIEATLKGAQVLILQGKRTEVAEFLQRVTRVNVETAIEEKVARFTALGDLYKEIGFHRKAAFFKRIAAMQCAALPHPGWYQCYSLLLYSLKAFKIQLDQKTFEDDAAAGWPDIRLRLFHEFLYVVKQLGSRNLVIRCACLALQVMFYQLNDTEKTDLTKLLESYTADFEPAPGDMLLEETFTFPPVSLSHFPQLWSFKVKGLPPHLAPSLSTPQVIEDKGPFIFSPFEKKSLRSVGPLPKFDSNSKVLEFNWAQDETSEVEISVYNPLPFELKVTNFALVTEGITEGVPEGDSEAVKFESHPSSHSLPPSSGPHYIRIVGVPRGNGCLRIKGYTTKTFGVVSKCLFSRIAHLRTNEYIVSVAPRLPKLAVSTALPRSPYLVTGGDNQHLSSAILEAYSGSIKECRISLKNTGKVPVDNIELSASSSTGGNSDLVRSMFSWAVPSPLPLLPGAEATCIVKVDAEVPQLHDRQLVPIPSSPKASSTGTTAPVSGSSLVEAILDIRYWGTNPTPESYTRQFSIAMDLVIKPTLEASNFTISRQEICSSFDNQTCLCMVGMTLLNASNVSFSVRLGKQSSSLKPMDRHRLSCTVQRCPSSAPLADVGARLCRYMDVRWEVAGGIETLRIPPVAPSGLRGRVCLTPAKWAGCDLSLLRKSPLRCVVQLEGGCASVGASARLTISVTNECADSFSSVHVSPSIYQRGGSSPSSAFMARVEPGTLYLRVVRSSLHIPNLAQKETVSEAFTLIFLHAGEFYVRMECSQQANQKLLNDAVYIPFSVHN